MTQAAARQTMKYLVIGLSLINGMPGFIRSTPAREKAKAFLKEVTEPTGGRVIFPKEKQTVKEIVEQLYAGVSADKK
ncbi:MAG: hypothetical protein H0U23_12110 [Blastocatellia bacterium]|nr:hypothetical protein [Blastocatellia bacterium]